jgi:hypothetical protein
MERQPPTTIRHIGPRMQCSASQLRKNSTSSSPPSPCSLPATCNFSHSRHRRSLSRFIREFGDDPDIFDRIFSQLVQGLLERLFSAHLVDPSQSADCSPLCVGQGRNRIDEVTCTCAPWKRRRTTRQRKQRDGCCIGGGAIPRPSTVNGSCLLMWLSSDQPREHWRC